MISYLNLNKRMCKQCYQLAVMKKGFSQSLDDKYNETQKEKIMKIINSEAEELSRYDITKTRLKQLEQWKKENGFLKSISDIEYVNGFSLKTANKLFESIVQDRVQVKDAMNKIKGQILHPPLSEDLRMDCKSVLAVYTTANSVSWTLIDRTNYEITEWEYHTIQYPDAKRMQITNILDIAWSITNQLPQADIYVMKAEATTLRAGGSDPNNAKMLAVNLQKSQMIAMIVALINVRERSRNCDSDQETSEVLEQKIYFLRPSLPFRLYGTLIGNERVSTSHTIEDILQNATQKSKDGATMFVSNDLKNAFKSKNDLQKDMLGRCLLLGLTFMDLCIYKNTESLNKLLKNR